MPASNVIDRRRHERFALPHTYTSVIVQRPESLLLGDLHGHAYDISESGVRIELDEPLPVGSVVSFQVKLPMGGGAVTGTAKIVWVNDEDDDPGPRRMALHIQEFFSAADHVRLARFLGEAQPLRAA